MKNLFTLFLLLGSVSSRGALPDLKTAAFVDLNQYSGVWYEIAAIPQWFERNCVGNAKAEYARAELDLVSIVNSCDVEGGKRSIVKGRAKVIDTASNSKLEVTFVNIFGWQFLLGGNYWILSVGDNYSYAIVGEPSRNYAWILSREPKLSSFYLNQSIQLLRDQAYDPCKLISTPQTGGLQEKTSVCRLSID